MHLKIDDVVEPFVKAPGYSFDVLAAWVENEPSNFNLLFFCCINRTRYGEGDFNLRPHSR